MNGLNLPPYAIKVREKDGRRQIFDFLRRKYVALTPEEWVRQHFVHYLVEQRGYPKGLVQNELQLRVGEKRLRCDSVVFDRGMRPLMIVEYKAPDVALTPHVMDQAMAYNRQLRVGYVVVSNGREHLCCRMDYEKREYSFVRDIPEYEELHSHAELRI